MLKDAGVFGGVALTGSSLLLPMRSAADSSTAALSRSVLSAASQSGQAFGKALKSKTGTSVKTRKLANNLETFFNHLEETGDGQKMYGDMKAAGLFDYPLTYQQMSSVRQLIKLQISDATFYQTYQTMQIAFPHFKVLASQGSLAPLNANVLSALDLYAIQQDKERLLISA